MSIHLLPPFMEHVGQHPTKLFSELLPVHGGTGGQGNLWHSERVFYEMKMHNNYTEFNLLYAVFSLHCMYSSDKYAVC